MNLKKLLWIPAVTGLVFTLLPSILLFSGSMTLSQHKWWMGLGTILWLATAPFLMSKKS